MIINSSLEQIQTSIAAAQTCVVNIVAQWCSDCTEQSKNLATLSTPLAAQGIKFYSLTVQQEKHVYLSAKHQVFTELLGGHGFPRTVLLLNGKVVDSNNVEIISSPQLEQLLEKFNRMIALP